MKNVWCFTHLNGKEKIIPVVILFGFIIIILNLLDIICNQIRRSPYVGNACLLWDLSDYFLLVIVYVIFIKLYFFT